MIEKEDYYRYRIQKAIETIKEIEIHIQNKFWNTAINRMYYACFYAVGALLVKNGVDVTSHSGARLQFGQHFVKTGKIDVKLGKHYSRLFEKRHKGDYTDFYDYDEEAVLRLLPDSKKLIDEIELLLKKD